MTLSRLFTSLALPARGTTPCPAREYHWLEVAMGTVPHTRANTLSGLLIFYCSAVGHCGQIRMHGHPIFVNPNGSMSQVL